MLKQFFLSAALLSSLYVAAQTPQLVYDIHAGQLNSNPDYKIEYNGKLYFAATDAVHGRELWCYDGVNQPALVADIWPGTANGFPDFTDGGHQMAVFNGKLYFTGNNGVTGYELMSYDGVNPPVLVADINKGSSSSRPQWMMAAGGQLYFRADVAGTGLELYVFDGINPPVGKDMVPFNPGLAPRELTELNGRIYFIGDAKATGEELYFYDPSHDTYGLAAEINPSWVSARPRGLFVHNGKIYFAAESNNNGMELYSFDGSRATRLTDVAAGSNSGVIYDPVLYRDAIYFDGSTDGRNFQLYKYDLNSGNVSLVKTIDPGGPSTITSPIVYKDKLYFSASDGVHGEELWMHDGTTTSLVLDINPGTSGSIPHDMKVLNGVLYFSANNGVEGTELYYLKGNTTSIQKVGMQGTVTAAPNPSPGDVTLELELKQAYRFGIMLTDVAGRMVWQKSVADFSSGSHQVKLPLSGKMPGLYFYRVYDAGGRMLASGQIVKQ